MRQSTIEPSVSVRDHIPLKQGLRHISVEDRQISGEVRDHIPLKQGLRRKTRC